MDLKEKIAYLIYRFDAIAPTGDRCRADYLQVADDVLGAITAADFPEIIRRGDQHDLDAIT